MHIRSHDILTVYILSLNIWDSAKLKSKPTRLDVAIGLQIHVTPNRAGLLGTRARLLLIIIVNVQFFYTSIFLYMKKL